VSEEPELILEIRTNLGKKIIFSYVNERNSISMEENERKKREVCIFKKNFGITHYYCAQA